MELSGAAAWRELQRLRKLGECSDRVRVFEARVAEFEARMARDLRKDSDRLSRLASEWSAVDADGWPCADDDRG
jgi:hypothetical protein